MTTPSERAALSIQTDIEELTHTIIMGLSACEIIAGNAFLAALKREEIARTITEMCDAGVLLVKSGNPWRPDSEKKTALFIADAIIAGILGGAE